MGSLVMKKLSNIDFISIITKLLFLIIAAKAISLALFWYLPSEGVELKIKPNYQPKYQRVNFYNMIKNEQKKVIKKPKNIDNGISITSMILKGLYGNKTKGYVIVAMKSSPKNTSIIGIGESYRGYKLKSISLRSAKFTKNGTDFILSLKSVKNLSSSISKVRKKRDYGSEEATSVVSRRDISYYAKNPNQIWRDISIRELRDGKKIKGFQVTNIKPNSRFAKLGLKRGDIIIKANNRKLQSYRDALDIYSRIDKLDAVQIVVLRNNQEVELVYEID
jgi:general secretion pathway protein C